MKKKLSGGQGKAASLIGCISDTRKLTVRYVIKSSTFKKHLENREHRIFDKVQNNIIIIMIA